MKILAFVASPRKGANTDIFADKFIEGAKSKSAEIEKIYLNDLQINPCQACQGCRETHSCQKSDDMTTLYEKIQEADGFLFASPIFWGEATGQMKIFWDRWYPYLASDFNIYLKEGKKAVIAFLCGAPVPEMYKPILDRWEQTMSFLGIDVIDKIEVCGNIEPDSITKNEDALKEAYDSGAKLAGNG